MILPNFMLRRTVEPRGVRLPKWTTSIVKQAMICDIGNYVIPQDKPKICAVCNKEVRVVKIIDRWQLDGHWRGGEFFHTYCYTTPKDYYPINRRQRKDPVQGGNLIDTEYRFWIGYPHVMSSGAVCRCCGKSFYTTQERTQHLQDDKMAVNGDRCAKRLESVYKQLLGRLRTCIVCHKDRHGHHKWGVPMCNSLECHKDWKFTHREYVQIKYFLDKQKGKEESPDHIWCDQCNMFIDNAGHTAVHEEWEIARWYRVSGS